MKILDKVGNIVNRIVNPIVAPIKKLKEEHDAIVKKLENYDKIMPVIINAIENHTDAIKYVDSQQAAIARAISSSNSFSPKKTTQQKPN